LEITNASIALDRAGLPHIGATVANNNGEPFVVYAVLPGADLAANWNDLALATIKRKTKLVGHLQVFNDGTAAANSYHITCFLSDVAVASASDPVIGKATVSLAPGADRVLTFDFNPAQAVSGKYVVARIDQSGNPSNNTAAIVIP